MRVVRRDVVHLLAEWVPEPPLVALGGLARYEARADDADVRASSVRVGYAACRRCVSQPGRGELNLG